MSSPPHLQWRVEDFVLSDVTEEVLVWEKARECNKTEKEKEKEKEGFKANFEDPAEESNAWEPAGDSCPVLMLSVSSTSVFLALLVIILI
jgi:hypothetical protein